MALGLAIIFGQSVVINRPMASSYPAVPTSLDDVEFLQSYLPGIVFRLFLLAMILAFFAAGALGRLVYHKKKVRIRHLYKRPLDRCSPPGLILSAGSRRSVAGRVKVGGELPQWMLGSLHSPTASRAVNGVFGNVPHRF